MGRKLALLVATNLYQDSSFHPLTAPEQDARALADVLQDARIAGFEVTTLINQPQRAVGEAIGQFYRGCKRDDLTLLYFTGHGQKDEAGRLHLVMTDTQQDNLRFTSLPAAQIDEAISECLSQQKILILDCCYSGAYPSGYTPRSGESAHALAQFDREGRGLTVLTASDSLEYSYEASGATQSIFTRHLVDGLRDGTADLNEDGDITLDELYQYVYERVVDEMPQQRPKRLDNINGQTLIATNVNWRPPHRLHTLLTSHSHDDRLAGLTELARFYRSGNDLVRSVAAELIQDLARDDSRRMSEAATEVLAGGVPPPPPVTDSESSAARQHAPAQTRGPTVAAALPAAVARRVPWWRRRVTLAAAVVILVLSVVGVVFHQPSAPSAPHVAAKPIWTDQNLPFGGIAESRDGHRVYVANFANDTVSIVDPATNTVQGEPISVGQRPEGVAVTADGRHVYVADSDDSTVAVIDTSTRAVTRISVPRGPFDVTAALDRPYIYVTCFDSQTVTVINADTGRTVRAPIRVRGHPMGIAIHPQGYRLYVVDDKNVLSVIDTATGKIQELTLTSGFPYNVATSPEGIRLYITTLRPNRLVTLDALTVQPVGAAIPVPGGPFGVAAGHNGLTYVTNFDADSLITVDTTSGRIVGAPIKLPISPRGLITVDDHRLYVTDGAGRISVVDTRTATTIGAPISLLTH